MAITINSNALTPSIDVNGVSMYLPTTDSQYFAMRSQLGFRNFVDNGAMEVAQYLATATTRTPAAAAAASQLIDRFKSLVATGSSGTFTVSQATDAPAAAPNLKYSLRATVGTADTSIASTDAYIHDTRLEGYRIRPLFGNTFTLSFWVRSGKTGIHSVSFTNNTDRAYVLQYTVNATDTWEYKTLTVTGGLTTAGTWNTTTGMGLMIVWPMAVGSNNTTSTLGSWVTHGVATIWASSNQVNVMDTASAIFAITGVQLELGSVATPYEYRPYTFEEMLCMRYYEEAPQSIAQQYPSPNTGGFAMYATHFWKVRKRITGYTLTVNDGTYSNVQSATTVNVVQDQFTRQYVSTTSTNTSWTWRPVADATF